MAKGTNQQLLQLFNEAFAGTSEGFNGVQKSTMDFIIR